MQYRASSSDTVVVRGTESSSGNSSSSSNCSSSTGCSSGHHNGKALVVQNASSSMSRHHNGNAIVVQNASSSMSSFDLSSNKWHCRQMVSDSALL
jgi:hypothetical protein